MTNGTKRFKERGLPKQRRGGGGGEASLGSLRNEVKRIVRDEREPKKHIIR